MGVAWLCEVCSLEVEGFRILCFLWGLCWIIVLRCFFLGLLGTLSCEEWRFVLILRILQYLFTLLMYEF